MLSLWHYLLSSWWALLSSNIAASDLFGWSGWDLSCVTERKATCSNSFCCKIHVTNLVFWIFSRWHTVSSPAGRWRRVGVLSWKTHQLGLFTSLWHICGCFHSDGSKDSWDVSEIQCADWLLDVSCRTNRKWERMWWCSFTVAWSWERNLLLSGINCFFVGN